MRRIIALLLALWTPIVNSQVMYCFADTNSNLPGLIGHETIYSKMYLSSPSETYNFYQLQATRMCESVLACYYDPPDLVGGWWPMPIEYGFYNNLGTGWWYFTIQSQRVFYVNAIYRFVVLPIPYTEVSCDVTAYVPRLCNASYWPDYCG